MCPINSSWGLTYLLCIGLWLHASNANLCTTRQAPFNNFQKLLHWWWNICQPDVINFVNDEACIYDVLSSGSFELSLCWAQAAFFLSFLLFKKNKTLWRFVLFTTSCRRIRLFVVWEGQWNYEVNYITNPWMTFLGFCIVPFIIT